MSILLETLNDKISTAIITHLLNVDALPPNTEVPALAQELTAVVFSTLQKEGITEEALGRLTTVKTVAATSQIV
jgi:hypothetical protein